jgi:TetR/AcrR family transcriptional repressor of bet genes
MTNKVAARSPSVKPARGRPPVGAERRADIANALLQVMAKTGYAKATVAAIARAARVSPALVHHHFADKHQVLVSLVERLVAGAEARLSARLEEAGDNPHRRLAGFVEAYVGLGPDANARAVAAWVVIGAEALRDVQVRALYRAAIARALARAKDLVSARLAAEGRPTRNAGVIAAAIIAAVEGAYRVTAAAPGLLPVGFAAPTLRRTIDGLIAAEECA